MPSRFHVFPWQEEEFLKGLSRRLIRPMVDVKLSLSPEAESSAHCLIDSGAPRTVFPVGSAIGLGLEVPNPDEDDLSGCHELLFLGTTWLAMPYTVTLELPPYEDLRWEAEVDFVIQEGLTYGLLGCEGFLDRWAVSFNGYHTYTVVEPIEDLDDRLPIDVFRIWQEEWPDYN